MCGIAGIIGKYEITDLEQMLQSTMHRGPDHTGIYKDDDLAIGINRLSIISLTKQIHKWN